MKNDATLLAEAKTLIWLREAAKCRHHPPTKTARRNRTTPQR